MSYFDPTLNEVVRPVKIPPILTNRECLDSVITCRVCWNGVAAQGMVYVKDQLTGTAMLVQCPECNGSKIMKSTTKEEKWQLWKQAKDENIPRHTIPGVTHL